jgi:excisionase family DNA binding protein
MSEKYLTSKEAAAYLQVNPKTLHRAVERGALRAGRVGRRYRFRTEWLDAYMDESVVEVSAMSSPWPLIEE